MSDNIFKKIFKSFLFYGIICLLTSALIDSLLKPLNIIETTKILEILVSIASIMFSSLGVGLIIGFFVDMVRGSKEYIDFIDKRLYQTIIKKDFLKQLSDQSNTNMIMSLIETKDNYFIDNKNAHKYLENKINNLYSISKLSFRTNFTYNADIFFDKTKNKVCQKTTIRYRLHKTDGKFAPIKTCFDKLDSYIEKIEVSCGEGKNKKYRKYDKKQSPFKLSDVNDAMLGYNEYINIREIDDIFQNESSITITKTIVEYGYDHWLNCAWISLNPTFDFSVNIKCRDNLKIKEYILFDDSNLFTNIESDESSFCLTSDTWLDSYTGFSLTISNQ